MTMSSSRSVQTLWRFAARKLLAPGCQHPAAALARGYAAEPLREHHSNDDPVFKGVLIDAAGTLLVPSESSANVYLRYARQYGVTLSEKEILQRYRRAYNSPWGGSSLRYVGDGRPFWRHIVAQATGCHHEQMFEDIYDYYARAEAWQVAPGATAALASLRRAGVKLAVVSNFDTRLQPLLKELHMEHLFNAVVVSAEVGAEKPNPVIFEAALERLGLSCDEVVHVGDDRRNDLWGARDAGICAWLWGSDVHSFDQVADMVLSGTGAKDDDDMVVFPQAYVSKWASFA